MGRLGTLALEGGLCYAYLGSALGPGGLAARVGRHLARDKPRHWHIDYLRPGLIPLEVWTTCDGVRREHLWAGAMAALPDASEPFPGFGASDCACASHLVAFPARPCLAAFRRHLRAAAADHAPIRRIGIPGDHSAPARACVRRP